MTPISSSLPLNTCFAPREVALLESILAFSGGLPSPLAQQIEHVFKRSTSGLLHLTRAIEVHPSVYSLESPTGGMIGIERLIDDLCECDPSGLDFSLPTRVFLGQSFLHAKINFYKDVIAVFHEARQNAPYDAQRERLLQGLKDILADAMYFKLVEELLIGCISNAANPLILKKAAAQILLPMWEQRHTPPIQEFTRLLHSAWRARCRVQEVFGTLVGFHEVLSLLQAECEPGFLDFFTRGGVTPDEREALREFLFGISYEDLQKLGHYMEEHGIRNVGPDDVSRILGHSRYQGAIYQRPFRSWSPEAVYLSYRRRRFRADYRVFTNQPGPHKTAEGYLLEYHLLHAPRAGEGCYVAPGTIARDTG